MAFRLASQPTYQWKIADNYEGVPFEFIGILRRLPEKEPDSEDVLIARVPAGEEYNEIDHGPATVEQLRRQFSRYQKLVDLDPDHPLLEELDITAMARAVFRGWPSPDQVLDENGEGLENTYENRRWLLNQAGIPIAVMKSWMNAVTGGSAELGNSPSSRGSGFTEPKRKSRS